MNPGRNNPFSYRYMAPRNLNIKQICKWCLDTGILKWATRVMRLQWHGLCTFGRLMCAYLDENDQYITSHRRSDEMATAGTIDAHVHPEVPVCRLEWQDNLDL